ncbi:MAG: acyl-CoA/acyl-ACP dehydrogenase [Saprospiraceae bacterium]|nr:acyl-CoA/acyl-ACP dehydrogenase [Bacteroidia bacterium]NNE13945.1 acyl-CoA/acyl-ACP dehydrogenase [Saprospiraceae bacterium]NNL93885.1 acyl-CoA/acyl-ACP dehydrogenase [Saprospiraceae bacterium]
MVTADIKNQVDYKTFLDNYKAKLKSAFYERDSIDRFALKRNFPPVVWREIMSANPLSVSVPSEYGGRGVKVKECLGMLAASSYESLALSLTFGINFALFLEPVAKYGQEEIKGPIFERFMNKQNMGGLAITEPDYGSDALNMQTYHTFKNGKYKIEGIKHWQGLTGIADYWLMTCRKKSESGVLGRDIDFFITDEQVPSQQLEVLELYNNLGLYHIPYGLNKVDIEVPENQKLIPETTGLKLMMDLLHRSRLQFPGMGMGFLERMLDEAIKQTTTRIVGGKSLLELDKIKHQVSTIQSAYVICSAMCHRSSQFSGIDNNVAGDAVEANSMKAYVTDLMQEASQTVLQLGGANGYKAESFGARGLVDSRPFRIFEGSNAMLYTQISEMILKIMGRKKITNLFEYLQTFEITKNATDYYKVLINFDVDSNLSQRRHVDLGKIIARLVCANHIINMGNDGFRPDLIKASLETIKHEITMLVSSYRNFSSVDPIVDYKDDSSWLEFVK